MKIVLLLILLVPFNTQASSFKELGERGGTKNGVLEKLGNPSIKKKFLAPNFEIKGVGNSTCFKANNLKLIDVWAYKKPKGFYQLVFDKEELICLRWSSSEEPFANIQP
ncbi:hypothetical protein [Aliiglaciecola lipolytica]|uniref:Uncharacterized protein n=1 Tax=Aliiglaciecola lipolytica E3 TaxID=1127673 RepID=K6YFH2_9ALTE|nr:hypothetical protein [Aliiglaciecola lipolytica]GAC15363.1 hypothetical protein GLIP_2742 [Aliiglaciecola lipolytica E3]